MSIVLVLICLHSLLAMNIAVLLSVVMGVCCWGWPSSLEGHLNGEGFFGIKVQCSHFSFSFRSKDVLLDLDEGMHGSIVENVLVMAFITEPEVSACPAPCFWGCEVGGVAVSMELHGAGVISDGCLWMGGEIIQHAIVLLDGVSGCLGLL